jgi:hypothetical protein
MSSPAVTQAVATARVLLCYVPKPSNDDGNAKGGANYFSGQINSIGGADHSLTPTPTVIDLGTAISASKLSAEFLRDTGTILVIGHGQPVYNAINQEFYDFLKRFNHLQSVIFISCELNKSHFDMPGFEANVINLLVQSLGKSGLKVYASKTDVAFGVLTAQHFVWMHTPTTHLVPALSTGVIRKNPQAQDVQNSMDIFSSNV